MIKNNLVYAPTASSNDYTGGTYAGPILVGSPTGATWTASSNSTDYQLKNTAPGYTVPPVALADWKPTTGYGVNGGEYVAIFDDFAQVARTGTNDMGAYQP